MLPPPGVSIETMSRRIRTGEVTPAELVESCLARIREREPRIKAWVRIAEDEARAQAERLGRELETDEPRSELHGIPVGVKDIYDTAGLATELGSPLERGRVPKRDSTLVAKLRSQGAIVLGKTHTTGYAYFDPAPTCNPHNLSHTPGGSSSGSAAAVADGMVPFAVGSQTMGSVLRPASYCGVVGFKPTYGALSLEGVQPFAPTLDHAGFFTTSVNDMSLVWAALGGDRVFGSAFPDKIAAPQWPIEGELEAPMREGFAAVIELLRAGGIAVEEAKLPESFQSLPQATLELLAREAATVHAERFREHGEAIGAKLAELVERGLSIKPEAYAAASAAIARARNDYAAWTARYPIVLTPAALGPAPAGLESTGDPRANAPWTSIGVPAISVPFGLADGGLPLGAQLSARRGDEGLLLATAAAVEQAFANEPRQRAGG